MASLPPEIWLQIIALLDHNKPVGGVDYDALKHLSIASSSLRSITQPVIFRDLRIIIQHANSEKVESRLNGLLELVGMRPECSQWIKSFRYAHMAKRTAYLYSNTPIPFDEDKFHNLTASVFVQLPALTYISLSDIRIALQMLSHIHQLPNLRSVDLKTVGLPASGEFEEEYTGLPVSTSISDLSIADNKGPHPAFRGLVSIPTIRMLSLGGPGSMQLIVDIIQARPSFIFPHLSTLNLAFEHAFNSLFDYPTLFPNLTSLDIYSSLYGRGTFPIPNPSALKTLKQFRGPLVFAALVLPGRPVEDLYIRSADNPHVLSVEMLSSLNTSKSVLRKLGICFCVWSNGCLALIGELFPGLECLSLFDITGDYMSWLEERLCDEIQGLVHLRTLALTTAYSYLGQNASREVQGRMLNTLGSSGPPTLRGVMLGRTTWRVDDQGHWAPVT